MKGIDEGLRALRDEADATGWKDMAELVSTWHKKFKSWFKETSAKRGNNKFEFRELAADIVAFVAPLGPVRKWGE